MPACGHILPDQFGYPLAVKLRFEHHLDFFGNLGKQLFVIRPLAYVKEKDLIKYAELKQFPIIPCNLCGSQPNLQRQVIGDMLRDWDKRFPGRIESMFSARHV